MNVGGDGVVREIGFLRQLAVGILSERRAFRPYGLMGGQDAAAGKNYKIDRDGKRTNLGGKNTFVAKRGERIRIETPGGGGYGAVGEKTKKVGEMKEKEKEKASVVVVRGSAAEYQALQEQA